ncbi:FlgD immunoglobulin-like domain containing protein [Candidatus Eisenbacteria bacterium]|uniref:FlgD immunoglobulin-like domain containing protein n=1 Tax=Eiseniibacteriota bacterium TaxID=2212470 RepID=A0ABV6YLG2_UNCEI
MTWQLRSTSCLRPLSLFVLGCAVTLAPISPTASAQLYEDAELLPADLESGDFYGHSCWVAGDLAIVGTVIASAPATDPEAAYIFRYDLGTDDWNEEAKFEPPGGTDQDWFGYSVAILGDIAIVAAKYDDDVALDAGAVYVFGYNAGTGDWTQAQKLFASDGTSDDLFGQSVAIDDGLLIVGASYADGNESECGAAHVFRYDPVEEEWSQEAKLIATDGEYAEVFGVSVDIEDNLAVIGTPLDDNLGDGAGSAYVFRYNPGAETWTQEAKLLAGDGAADDYFGYDVALSGDAVVVGAPDHAESGTQTGAAYVFRYDPGVPEWSQEAKLLAADGYEYDVFGRAVDISENLILVGADGHSHECLNCGAAYLYGYDSTSSDWSEITELQASTSVTDDSFGWAVGLDGKRAVVTALHADRIPGGDSGAAYAYECSPVVDPGVCCVNTLCSVTTEHECDALAGNWFVSHTSCDPNPCLSLGACCFPEGSCQYTLADDCLASGGQPQGFGTVCNPNPCPQMGACCLDGGGCIYVYEDECDGVYWLDAFTCDPNRCLNIGACCFDDGSCEVMRPNHCEDQNGTLIGYGIPCDPDPCLLPPGACCMDEECQLLSLYDCQDSGGEFQGWGIPCSPDPCCTQCGACCYTDGTCTIMRQTYCQEAGGTFMGTDVSCYPNPCLPVAVCCMVDGTCVVSDEIDCGMQGGIWHVEWASCDPNPCEVVGVDDERWESGSTTALLGVRPNPFRSTTDIMFRLASETMVDVSIYDASGRRVRTLTSETMSPGEYRITWGGDLDQGGQAGAGVYLCRFRVGKDEESTKIFRYR